MDKSIYSFSRGRRSSSGRRRSSSSGRRSSTRYYSDVIPTLSRMDKRDSDVIPTLSRMDKRYRRRNGGGLRRNGGGLWRNGGGLRHNGGGPPAQCEWSSQVDKALKQQKSSEAAPPPGWRQRRRRVAATPPIGLGNEWIWARCTATHSPRFGNEENWFGKNEENFSSTATHSPRSSISFA
jgi:hypothetical protein